MAEQHRTGEAPAPMERRVAAVEQVLEPHLREAGLSVDRLIEAAEEKFVPENGARVVARAWVDPEFRSRLLVDGKAAVAELGFGMPQHHRRLVVLENTPKVHNVIVCTLCSCTATSLLGPPPDWYKDLEYRARVVRESRVVLAEMGLGLTPEVEVRVWDTTADTRYMVLPLQPQETVGWPEERLVSIVTRDSLIGVARL
jgi:nitrile hydratase subunit alpha